jgi:type I restriction enzyme, S subunit
VSGAWEEAAIADVADLIRGVTYSKADATDAPRVGYSPVLRATNIQDARLVLDKDLVFVPSHNVSAAQRLRPGDIVVATSSGSKHLVGKSALMRADWAGSFGAFCAAIRPKASVEARYLAAFLQSPRYWEQIGRKAMGVNINNLRRGDIESVVLPVPPIADQRRIVAEIEKQFSRLDEAVANLQRVRANLKRVKASVLKAAVEGRLVETEANIARSEARTYECSDEFVAKFQADPRRLRTKRSRERIAPAVSPDRELPSGWSWVSADDVCSQITDGEHIQPKYQRVGYPLLTAKNVRDGYVAREGAGLIGQSEFENCLKRCAPAEGDILIVSVGATTGRSAIVGPGEPFALVRSVLLLKPLVVPRFLLAVVQSPACQAYIRRASGSTAQAHLYIKDTRCMPIPVPPLAEQHRIVAELDRRLSIIEGAEAEVDANLKRAQSLRQAVLAKNLSGA